MSDKENVRGELTMTDRLARKIFLKYRKAVKK
jgi:hypothetical protein